MKNILIKNYYLIIAIGIFVSVLSTKIDFYKAVVLLLEFIVILEVVKEDILFLLFVIFVFFIFRVMALFYSPTIIKKQFRKSSK